VVLIPDPPPFIDLDVVVVAELLPFLDATGVASSVVVPTQASPFKAPT